MRHRDRDGKDIAATLCTTHPRNDSEECHHNDTDKFLPDRDADCDAASSSRLAPLRPAWAFDTEELSWWRTTPPWVPSAAQNVGVMRASVGVLVPSC